MAQAPSAAPNLHTASDSGLALMERRLAALAELRKVHARILARRGGVPIDVDAVLDEMRGSVGDD